MGRRELDILRSLGNDHPHVLPMLHCAEMRGELVLLTPYAPEGDLEEFVPRHAVLEEVQVRRLCFQALSGLAFVHGKRVIHGDIKPANMFLSKQNGALILQLADFGLSVLVPKGECTVLLDKVQGSPGFIPAEVINSKQASFSIDLFALGVIVFRLLAGHDPFYPVSKVTNPVEYDDACWEPVTSAAKA